MEKYISQALQKALNEKKVFIFDFDGTLASTNEILFQTLKKLCTKYGHTYTREEFDSLRGKPAKDYFEQFKSFVSVPVETNTLVEEYLKTFDEIMETQELKCYEYVKEIIKLFPDKTYCVASNNAKKFLEQRLKEFGFEKQFTYIFDCGTGELSKQMLYANTEKFVNANPSDCVLFEDTQKYLDAGKECGLSCVGIVHKDKPLSADYLINLSSEED